MEHECWSWRPVVIQDACAGQEARVPVSNSAWQDRLHHHAGLLTSNDPEPKPSAIVDQVDHLHLTPVTGNDWVGGGERLRPASNNKVNSTLGLLEDCDGLLVGDVAVQYLQPKKLT